MITPIVYVILAFVPAGIVALVLDIWYRFHGDGKLLPVSDKLLCPPGESCRQKIEQLNNRITELDVWIMGFPSTFLLCCLSCNYTRQLVWPVSQIWFITFALAATASMIMFFRRISLIRQREEWRLAFSGKRAVGELLNQLMTDGCRVYHDVEIKGCANIDHIVVAPTGVFAISTCTHRKSVRTPELQSHEVVFDGKALEFPFQRDMRLLARSRESASRLAEHLNESLGFNAPVLPAITLPGWYVIAKGTGDVLVVNPRHLSSRIVTSDTPVLSQPRIREIAKVLDRKSRVIEF
jgi:hypothetical protein